MAHATRLAPFLLLAALATARASDDAAPAPATPPGGAPADAEAPPLPPPAPGRQVVLDSRIAVSTRDSKRTLSLSDIDPETARLVREINSRPGSWQLLLLATSQDLPEKMFHPGFAIRLKPRALPAAPPEQPDEAVPPPQPAAQPPAGKPPAGP